MRGSSENFVESVVNPRKCNVSYAYSGKQETQEDEHHLKYFL